MTDAIGALGAISADSVQNPILRWPERGEPQANASARKLFQSFPGWHRWRTLDQARGLDDLCSAALMAPIGKTSEALIRPLGGQRDAPRVVARLVRAAEDPSAVIATMRVVEDCDEISTQERLNFERAELALSLTEASFWDWSIKTNEVHLSDSWYRSLGYEPHELPMAASTWEDSVHPDDLQNTWDSLVAYVLGMTDKFDFINRMQCKDGSYRWNRKQGFIIERAPNGTPTRMIGTDRDIDEEFALYEQLRKVQRPGSIGTLTSGIAHDFNNILSPILLLSGMAKENMDDTEQVTQWLKEIEIAAIRARDLIRQLMRLNRQSEDEWRPILVAEVVESCLPLISRTVASHTQIKTDIGGEFAVMCDPINIEQIVLNLCTNALQAMPEGGDLCVRVRDTKFQGTYFGLRNALTDGEDVVEIIVSDTGTGIPQHDQGDIFDPYFTTKARGEGTGLGLSVVSGLVSDYGGAIAFESTIGEGTTFQVSLPKTTNNTATPAQSAPAAVTLADRRIMLVEGDPATLSLMKQALEQAGMTVIGVGTSAAAVAIFEKDPFAIDVVISDLVMQGMNGDQLSHHLKTLRPELPFIILSGYAPQNADHGGVDAWVAKPTTIVEVIYIIRSLIIGDAGLPLAGSTGRG